MRLFYARRQALGRGGHPDSTFPSKHTAHEGRGHSLHVASVCGIQSVSASGMND